MVLSKETLPPSLLRLSSMKILQLYLKGLWMIFFFQIIPNVQWDRRTVCFDFGGLALKIEVHPFPQQDLEEIWLSLFIYLFIHSKKQLSLISHPPA